MNGPLDPGSDGGEATSLIMGFPSLPYHIHPLAAPETDDVLQKSLESLPELDAFLEQEATLLLVLLYEVDAAKNLALYSPEGMNRAVQRYETCWLPLLAKHRGVRDMGAPLDVAWAWLMHALAPSKYAADVQSIAGVAASAIQADSPQHRSPEAMSNARELWEAEFGNNTYDPPGLQSLRSREDAAEAKSRASYVRRSRYDLEAAAGRQEAFLYQVSLPHWKTQWFMRKCVRRYRGFLRLRRDHRKAFLVPSYDIDLVWHAHMAGHARYIQDIQTLTNANFDHDDSINDRVEGGQLENGFFSTTKLWQEVYKHRYAFEGGMYRGQLPPEVLLNFHRKGKLSEEAAGPRGTAYQIDLGPATSRDYENDCLVTVPLLHQGRRCGTMYQRTPLSLKGRPACVLVLDPQGAVRAVSRILPRAHQPRREQEAASLAVPLYEEAHQTVPPFQIQNCSPDGSSSDWAIVQLELADGAIEPHLYRLGSTFHCQRSLPTSTASMEYVGMSDNILRDLGISGAAYGSKNAGMSPEANHHKRGLRRKVKQWFKGQGSRRTQSKSTASTALVCCWQAECLSTQSTYAPGDCFCGVAALGTLKMMYQNLYG